MSTTTLRSTIVLMAMLWAGLNLQGQNSPGFETISTAQGLSQGMIFGMLQDRDGFIWVATKEGLNRYDGYSFRVFTNDPANPFSLSSNYIRNICEDSKGRIWAVTADAGINVYDKKTGRFHRIMNDPRNSASLSGNRFLSAIIELDDGTMVVSPENGGINTISLPDHFPDDNPTVVVKRYNLPGNPQPVGIGKDDKGKLWVGCPDKKIFLFNASSGTFELLCDGKIFTTALARAGKKLWASREVLFRDTVLVYRPFDTLGHLIPGTLTRDADGGVSIGPFGKPPPGTGYSHFYDFSNCRPGAALLSATKVMFTSKLINLQVMMIDRSGIVWAGTNGIGINKYNLASARFHHLAPGFSVRNIVRIGSDSLYLAAWTADRFINKNGDAIANPVPSQITTYNVNSLLVSRSGEYWIWKAARKKLLRYSARGFELQSYPLDLLGTEDNQPIYEDRQGFVWVCGLGGRLARIQPASGSTEYFKLNSTDGKDLLSQALTTAFYEDAAGVLWVGTDEGFGRFVPGGKVAWYKNQGNGSLTYNHVSCLLDDPSDNRYLWIATKGGGLNRMDKQSGTFIHLTTRDGLPNDVVYGILSDSAGNIWGSTNRGIFCMMATHGNGTSRVFRNFTKSDGLQGEEFNTGGFAKLPSGELVFGGVNGLNVFNPSEILAAGYQPAVFITNILIDNKQVAPGDKTTVLSQTIESTSSIVLTHLQDILTLEFSSLDFTAPHQNKYRYQLEGIDNNWVESDSRRSATYLHLPAGTYTFRVQGTNSQGEWSSHIAELHIRVLPPWWMSWWAWILYALVFALGIGAYFNFSVNRARLRSQLAFEQLEARRVKELDTLKTQLYTNITHEFRTPLTVIMGMAKQVINNPEVKFDKHMEMIVRNGQNLLDLVNEMLDLSKLETGKMELQLIEGDVLHYLRYLADPFSTLASGQHKTLSLVSAIDSLFLSYDAEKLRQIVANLLSNALKFTPENGTIYITIDAEEYDSHVSLILKVRDSGMGIPATQLQHVFERFYQLDNTNTRKAEGTGIGLALTRELVKLMNGEISVMSPPPGAGTGSEFTVVLPLLRATQHEQSRTHHAIGMPVHVQMTEEAQPLAISLNGSQAGEQPLILLVEDNADVAAYTASCLSGYRLAIGRDGREGAELAKQLVPDLVITDVMMPFVDGFELCRILRAHEHTSHIPVIMLTAKADLVSRIQGLEHGADVYLDKPFSPDELLVRIKKLLELRIRLRQHYLRTAGLTAIAEQAAIRHDDPITEKKVEDVFVTRVRKAIEENIDDAGFTVEHLCRLVFMSHSQLHRKLDALTGLSPNKFIRAIRLSRSKQLLRDGADSIMSVALDCGYNDPGYFARVFKQEFGCTPQEWRSQSGALQ